LGRNFVIFVTLLCVNKRIYVNEICCKHKGKKDFFKGVLSNSGIEIAVYTGKYYFKGISLIDVEDSKESKFIDDPEDTVKDNRKPIIIYRYLSREEQC